MKKIAVILFNLGGPASLGEVRGFLFALFNDPAIINLPQPLRFLVASLISRRREKTAQAIYAQLGGRSPILENTAAQAKALEAELNRSGGASYKCFMSMRYALPRSADTMRAVENFAPDEIVLLPLYPQFSTTTTASSFKDWEKAAQQSWLKAPTKSICCYPDEAGFIQTVAQLTRAAIEKASPHGKPRILFSAHGLPEKIIRAGDPYATQCGQTVRALAAELGLAEQDYVLCYQSRVGPLKWIGPATDDEIRRAGKDRVPLVVVPVAFVSEHSETLVEIDRDYRHLAQESGVPFFVYAGTAGTAPEFIAGLAGLVQKARANESCISGAAARTCGPEFTGCCRNKVAHAL